MTVDVDSGSRVKHPNISAPDVMVPTIIGP